MARPKTGIGPPLGLRLHPDIDTALDAWIASRPDPKPSKPEAIRQLLRAALNVPSVPQPQDGTGTDQPADEGEAIEALNVAEQALVVAASAFAARLIEYVAFVESEEEFAKDKEASQQVLTAARNGQFPDRQKARFAIQRLVAAEIRARRPRRRR